MRRSTSRLSPAQRRRLMLVIATAEERLMRAHASAAAAFVGAVADDLPFERALAIYLRLLDVPSGERRGVAVRALALLSRRLPAEALAVGAEGDGAGPVHRLARRIRGRRQPSLRARIDEATVQARRAVRAAHLAGAAAVAEALDGAMEPAEAVQAYLDALDLGPGWAARIFHDAVAAAAAARD